MPTPAPPSSADDSKSSKEHKESVPNKPALARPLPALKGASPASRVSTSSRRMGWAGPGYPSRYSSVPGSSDVRANGSGSAPHDQYGLNGTWTLPATQPNPSNIHGLLWNCASYRNSHCLYLRHFSENSRPRASPVQPLLLLATKHFAITTEQAPPSLG